MARRKQKHLIDPGTMVGLLLTVGAVWLIAQIISSRGFLETIGVIIVLGGAVTIAFIAISRYRRTAISKALCQKAQSIIEAKLNPLVVKRAQLVWPDAYGRPQMEKWTKEKDRFISQQIEPALSHSEGIALGRDRTTIANLIEARVAMATQDRPVLREFSDDMTPAEFETFCAEELDRAGWSARVTTQSHDQGVDVIAEKGDVRVVIQCKKYTRPVGNKSVQEAAAAKAHEQANYGIVVSNARYTSAAEQLASTNGILLLHYSDLANLHNLLGSGLRSSMPPTLDGLQSPP
jgi:restriction system protein